MFDRESKTQDQKWVPGSGPEVKSVLRLTKQFSMPKRPMGEAWFMGAKRRFIGLQIYFSLLSMSSHPDPGHLAVVQSGLPRRSFFLAQLPTRIESPSSPTMRS